MNKITLLYILFIISTIISAIALYESHKSGSLVYVDINKLIEGYNNTKTKRQKFDSEKQKMKARVDSLLNSWQTELKQFEKDKSTFTSKEFILKKEILSNKQKQINSYQESVQNHLYDEDKKITQTIINEINDYIKEYGKSNGYDIIFGASGTGNIMYADESTDLTDKVLEGLNRKK